MADLEQAAMDAGIGDQALKVAMAEVLESAGAKPRRGSGSVVEISLGRLLAKSAVAGLITGFFGLQLFEMVVFAWDWPRFLAPLVCVILALLGALGYLDSQFRLARKKSGSADVFFLRGSGS
jgi:hypothetical protein